MADIALKLDGVSHSFGHQTVLSGVVLEIFQNSALCLLGPSGCGKTTLLRIIAGILRPKNGHVLIDQQLQDGIPPHKRNIGFVFQSEEALFPHLNVFGNVEFPLRHRCPRMTKADRKRAVNEILYRTRMTAWAKSPLANLSGGQRQRVAVARSLVYKPSILLLDEPLSSLDNVLKIELLELLQELRKNMKTTFVYVTHDDREARVFASHIAVLMKGCIQQYGTAEEVIRSPASEDIRKLLGVWQPDNPEVNHESAS